MTVILTRVECLCGAIAAIPDGGFFPLCGQCGRRMVCPPRGEPGTRDHGNVLAYVAELVPEGEASRATKGTPEDEWRKGHVRQYTDEDLVAKLEARHWPTEPQPWPERPCGDGLTYTAPPWEPVAA